ncbi:MAG TPA: M24 family metallopeptidase [Acidimicrobiales bacterium]|nr:M24 family metallopeptidase [Acidimicrobiales bacterium]
MTTSQVWTPTAEDLVGYRSVQQLAYRCAETVAATLEPGVTERAVARRMREWLLDAGVDDWFHVPFAWFGDRTAFRGFRTSLQFFPTDRQLVEGMPFILDCAPVVKGYSADIGYASSFGPNPTVDRILDDLAAHRSLILDLARQRRPLREIYEAVDALASQQGYENRHRRYPFGVIAHQVGPLPTHPRNVVVAGFGLRSLRALVRNAAVGRARGSSPLWSDSKRSAHPPTPGLWAVEPHLGTGDVAAKFEELLVVTDDDVFWLDDDLPHVRRWNTTEVKT